MEVDDQIIPSIEGKIYTASTQAKLCGTSNAITNPGLEGIQTAFTQATLCIEEKGKRKKLRKNKKLKKTGSHIYYISNKEKDAYINNEKESIKNKKIRNTRSNILHLTKEEKEVYINNMKDQEYEEVKKEYEKTKKECDEKIDEMKKKIDKSSRESELKYSTMKKFNDECPICLEQINMSQNHNIVLDCGHVIHINCTSELIKHMKYVQMFYNTESQIRTIDTQKNMTYVKCPFCRLEIDRKKLLRNIDEIKNLLNTQKELLRSINEKENEKNKLSFDSMIKEKIMQKHLAEINFKLFKSTEKQKSKYMEYSLKTRVFEEKKEINSFNKTYDFKNTTSDKKFSLADLSYIDEQDDLSNDEKNNDFYDDYFSDVSDDDELVYSKNNKNKFIEKYEKYENNSDDDDDDFSGPIIKNPWD